MPNRPMSWWIRQKIGQTCFAKVAPLKRAIVITSQGHELLQTIKEKTEVIEV